MNTKKEMFSLSTHFGGKVNQVGFIVKDVEIGKDKELAAMVFITFKLADGTNIEAQMPLGDSVEFKNHICAIVEQAIELKKSKELAKEKKDGNK